MPRDTSLSSAQALLHKTRADSGLVETPWMASASQLPQCSPGTDWVPPVREDDDEDPDIANHRHRKVSMLEIAVLMVFAAMGKRRVPDSQLHERIQHDRMLAGA